ncbi:MAG: AI-2E family transporter [Mariprofundaceae bacterium]|nr:AI-2E family transporter [Mariprofundaceae bacterium]
MVRKVSDWLSQRMADTQLMMLLASLIVIFTLVWVLGDVLAPVLFAIALAYVLDGIVQLLTHCKVPRLLSVILVCVGALLMVLFAMLAILPLLTDQVARLVQHVPQYITSLRTFFHDIQTSYAAWLNPEHFQQVITGFSEKIQEWGGAAVSMSLSSIPGLIALLVYAVLVPVLVFFLLKDKENILQWGKTFLPRERSLLARVWRELDMQIGNYIRGRFWESFMVGFVMWLTYWMMGHEYGLLLGVLTGISVWIPFVGAAVVALPVLLLSFFQWGTADMTLYAVLAYAVIQLIDANIVIPWLFSEVVNLHPIAIIVAVLFFGSLWGILGVFIAIPMAALVQSVLIIIAERAGSVR